MRKYVNAIIFGVIIICVCYISVLHTKIDKISQLIQMHSISISSIDNSIDDIENKIQSASLSKTFSARKNNIQLQQAIQISPEDNSKFYTKIAIIDFDDVLARSYAIKDIKQSISRINKKLHYCFSEKEKKIKEQENKIISQKGLLSKADYDKSVIELNKAISTIQQEKHKKKSELDKIHGESIEEVYKQIMIIIKDLSQQYGFNISLASSQIIFADNNNTSNITSEVINILNTKLKTLKIDLEIK